MSEVPSRRGFTGGMGVGLQSGTLGFGWLEDLGSSLKEQCWGVGGHKESVAGQREDFCILCKCVLAPTSSLPSSLRTREVERLFRGASRCPPEGCCPLTALSPQAPTVSHGPFSQQGYLFVTPLISDQG